MVDGITTTGADGKASWAPRPPEEMDDAAAAGAVGDRLRRRARRHGHDRVARSSSPPPGAGHAGRAAGRGSSTRRARGWRSSACSAAIVLALILFVLRPMLARPPMLDLRRADRAARAAAEPRRVRAAEARHPRPAGADREQDRAAARGHRQPRRGSAPPCCAAGSNPPIARRSPQDHERLSPARPSPPAAGARARALERAPDRRGARGGLAARASSPARRRRPRPSSTRRAG